MKIYSSSFLWDIFLSSSEFCDANVFLKNCICHNRIPLKTRDFIMVLHHGENFMQTEIYLVFGAGRIYSIGVTACPAIDRSPRSNVPLY